jgi:uncharacterized protein (DUF2267 family)
MMPETGLAAFDTTLQKTHVWLKAIMAALGTEDRHRAYLALRSTLHALRDRLPPEAAADLGAQLPMLIRGLYYEGWRPSATPRRDRKKQDFLSHIENDFPFESEEFAEQVVRAVLGVLSEHVTEGEVQDVKHLLPEPIRALWPTTNA